MVRPLGSMQAPWLGSGDCLRCFDTAGRRTWAEHPACKKKVMRFCQLRRPVCRARERCR